MKFKDFVDDEIKEFRELKLGLIEKSDANTKNELVRKIQQEFNLGTNLIELKNNLNKKWLTGKKYLIDFINFEEKIKVDQLKINKNVKKRLKEEFFKSSSEFAKNQTEVERKIAEKK